MRVRVFISLLPLVFLTACAGYHLGPTNGLPAGAKSVQVTPFSNETLEPRLIEPIEFEIRKRIQQDGTYRLATHDDGDLLVSGVITKFDRSPISYQPNDVLSVRDYHLTITARIIAVDRISGKTNANQIVRGRTTVRVQTDLASAERQAIPLAAVDLARNAVNAIADGTW
jgi:hypothetical protein